MTGVSGYSSLRTVLQYSPSSLNSNLRAYLLSPFRLEFPKFWSKKVQFSSLNLDSVHQIAHFLPQNLKNSSGKRDELTGSKVILLV